MNAPQNPSAFPLNPTNDGTPGAFEPEPGMSLRDWFAGQALASVIIVTSAGQHRPEMREGETHIRLAMARDAYDMADAMLAARTQVQP